MSKVMTIFLGLFLLLALIFTGACGNKHVVSDDKCDTGLKIVTSISILADIAENIIGTHGTVHYIVPIGENPEDYNLMPSEFHQASNADVVFINGLGLESMIERSLRNVTSTKIVHLTDGINTIPLTVGNVPDPHAWFDVQRVIMYTNNILAALVEIDPAGSKEYQQNVDAYTARLLELDDWIRQEVESIPEQNRVIVISENAMKYFGEAYGFRTEGIWELNAHEEGTPQQISRVVEMVVNEKVPALFVETTVDKRYMKIIARETGVPIAGKLYTDALGPHGSGADTYIDMMMHNVNIISKGLSKNKQ